MPGRPGPAFPAGEYWVPDRCEVIFPAVLPSEDRLNCRVPADVIRDVAGLPADCLPRDIHDAFRTHKRAVFVPAAERLLAEGRIGDAGDGREFVFIDAGDLKIE